jgi:hypothetical protein
VLDFFPIEGTHKTVREVTEIYSRFQHGDRIASVEGYHDHQFSPENQEAAMEFLDHFNGLPARRELAPVKELEEKELLCTRTGQVMTEFADARSMMDVIREYYLAHKGRESKSLRDLYIFGLHPHIDTWKVAEYQPGVPVQDEIRWEKRGEAQVGDVTIEKFLLHHSHDLQLPLLYLHKGNGTHRVLLWVGENGKLSAQDWPDIRKYLDAGYDVVSVDPRGLGETRMAYKALSPDDPALAKLDSEQAYVNPLSSVLADYVYNSLLIGRPYFFQMIEDEEIALRFVTEKMGPRPEIKIIGMGHASTLARAVSETLPQVKLLDEPEVKPTSWAEIVDQKMELWPIQYLLPGGAYMH